MNIRIYALPLLLLSAVLCCVACSSKKRSFSQIASRIGRESSIEQYPKVPHEEILNVPSGNMLYAELKDRYTQSLTQLKAETEKDGAKLVVVVLTPEVGKSVTPANIQGIPHILLTCQRLGIRCYDFSEMLANQEATNITQLPFDGHWSKAGATYVASLFMPVIDTLGNYSSGKTFPESARPATFGDLPPNDDEMLDGEKDLPYHLKTNSQGLRMAYNLTFPKRKQRILFLGDSQVFSPFLDNQYIATSLLQDKYPDKEILNAGFISYTMEDYTSLYTTKARYAEPDVVIVCTNGGDILDYFFSERNRFSRLDKSYKPSPLEKKFYDQVYQQ